MLSPDLFEPAFMAVKNGFLLTLVITVASFCLGQILALPLALGLTSERHPLRLAASTYTFFVRGSPLLVQLFIIYYGLGQIEAIRDSFLWPILRSPVYCAILAIALNSAAYSAELLAGAIRQLPSGQWEAGKALGIGYGVLLVKIVLPQAYRAILPAIGNELVLVMKGSTLASAVTVMEVTGATRVFVARSYAPFETFLIAGTIYLVLGAVFGRIFRFIETRTAIPGR
ncbi:ABC transporter permease [Rhizobium laguerreae]|uniref:ABC transporter permease n=1 Tax=Rhizobium laguerreae TaxID=1076926 RepID=UPI001C90C01B|nr:ABC transporter permease subunit [Rhizobium laguerreae]MBY3348383.1 ABC transporter permease subunit [Rhizobium laguerreae]MBY3355401.1 ABC transporter permease subunit [Rhizobium laguerreae]MBY3369284.1 ABC transporter permease subunit [Rhizobium laguerreae]MBY3376537.1 ABC transporter permease subunit [Rhizobium laguerreae]MBY3390603.1 ABC transporter permease subunit [Rhizobium laguerreae]